MPANPLLKTERKPYRGFIILLEFFSGTLLAIRIEGHAQTFTSEDLAKKWVDAHPHLREAAELPRPRVAPDQDEQPRRGISP